MLELQVVMLRRYATGIHWPIYLATEVPEHELCKKLEREFDIQLLLLKASEAGFLESRAAALRMLPSSIKYVLPLQEDFLLDRQPMVNELLEALYFMETDKRISSVRLMPCPGPIESDIDYKEGKSWAVLSDEDAYHFTYQATFWRKEDLLAYFSGLLETVASASENEKKSAALTYNIAEIYIGKELLKKILPSSIHLAYKRVGKWSNAVYQSPWPYRPTAIVRGKVEPFAEELFKREGVAYSKPFGSLL